MSKLRRRTALVLVLLAVQGIPAASAAEKAPNFVDPSKLDLRTLLPPPPAVNSAKSKAELAEIHAFEKTRTPEREKIAQDDEAETVFVVVRDDLGPDFNEANLPVTAAFFKKVLSDESAIVNPAKELWARPRPAIADPTVKLCVKPSTSGSYPSGHTTIGYLTAIVLSDMLPEYRGAIFDDAARFAESRIICGVHYRSDTDASKVAAAVMVMQMRENPTFQQEFAAAKAEIRKFQGQGRIAARVR